MNKQASGAASNLQPLRIGEWGADPASNTLSRGHESVRVEPKAMEVLMRLAADPGQVVTRRQLFDAVWPGVVVGDEALTQSVIKLRRALGDASRAPTYIETISKRGYRLVAPTARLGANGNDEMPPMAATAGALRSARAGRRGLAAAALAACVVAAGAVAYFVPSDTARPGATRTDDPRAGVPAVTVLPLDVLSDDSDQRYLARGIRDDLLTGLARAPGLRLIGASGDHAARYVVGGSVQRLADQVRVNVRLVDAATQRLLWSEHFERPYRDLAAAQDATTHRVLEAVPRRIADAALEQRAVRYTRSRDAYDAFARGQALFLVRQADDNQQARAFYLKAVEHDPLFARAYAGLAMTYAIDPILRGEPSASPSLARAFEFAETAREIDPRMPEVYWAVGFVNTQARRHTQAIAALERAIALDPSYADAYALLAGVYTYVGRPDQSIPLLRKALRLNPDGGYLYYLLLGRAYLFEGDVEMALINLREAAVRNPVDVETRVYLAAALSASGDRAGARWQADEIRAVDDDFTLGQWLGAYPMTSARQRERLVALLAPAGL
jgi:DNA-binding winged helix-turn-helix (wHTH) protein/TolB-like protein/Tfp pilus assembly protein PilF